LIHAFNANIYNKSENTLDTFQYTDNHNQNKHNLTKNKIIYTEKIDFDKD